MKRLLIFIAIVLIAIAVFHFFLDKPEPVPPNVKLTPNIHVSETK